VASILVVDDRPSNRQFMSTLLGYLGHQVLEAGNGEEALRMMRSAPADLLITDILMPTMDGYELVQRMHEDAATAGTPVIFWTATYSHPEALKLAASSGVGKVLPKPCDPDVIMAAVNEALGEAAPPVRAEQSAPAAVRAHDMSSIDDSMGLYLNDLRGVRAQFDDLAKRSSTLRAERDQVRDLSRQFSANVEKLQRVTGKLSALIEVGLEMTSERDPERLVELFFAGACELVESKIAGVGVLDEQESALKCVLGKGIDPEVLRAGSNRGLLDNLLTSKLPVRLRGASVAGLPAGHPTVQSVLALPVASAERAYGWLYFAERKGGKGFSDEDERVALIMAKQLALLYEHALLYDVIQRHAATLQIEAAERKRAEEQLLRFRAALDNSPDIILIIDRATMRYVDVNEAGCRLLGYTREELLGMHPHELMPISQEALERAYDALISSPRESGGMNSYYRCKDGSQLPFESTRRVLRHGDSWLIVAVSRDIRQKLAAERALKESEAGLRRAQSIAGLAHVITGPDGAFESWSETLPALAGIEPPVMPHSTRVWLLLLHPDDRAHFRERSIEAGRSGRRAAVEYRLRRPDGALVTVHQILEPLAGERDAEGRATRWFNTLQDITETRKTEARIKRLNRVYAVLSGINTLIVRVRSQEELFREACRIAVEAGQFRLAWIGLVEHDADAVRVAAWAGDGEGYVERMPLSLSQSGEAGAGLAGLVVARGTPIFTDDMLQDPRILLWEDAERRNFRSLAILPLATAGKLLGVIALYAPEVAFFDQDEMKLLSELAGDIGFALEHLKAVERADYLAFHDPLTGLPNRAVLVDHLELAMRAARRRRQLAGVVFLDVERFRQINESLGRPVGDRLLTEVAARIGASVRSDDTLARIGGDVFALVVAGLDNVTAAMHQYSERLRDAFAQPVVADGHELRVVLKGGVSIFPNDADAAETLCQNAEAALRRAKETGSRFLFYTSEMNARVNEKLDLENRLRGALLAGQFVLHYQPKVDTTSRALVGLEALIRWQDPELGLVPPGRFIPLMEETGIILEVGRWALKRAVEDVQAWRAKGLAPPRVAVNVSPMQLRQADFVKSVLDALECFADADPVLDLEITESMVMQNLEATIRALQTLRGVGVETSLDDFGTGYSSLAYVARLPVAALKIDRSFVIEMTTTPYARTIVQTVITLAHSLGLRVIAEGVDHEDQVAILAELGCDQLQGYLISKPIPPEQVEALLARA
jgi:diguanylate cyclase (GGDEF)-like protein/PAS domain S-box-containing protein